LTTIRDERLAANACAGLGAVRDPSEIRRSVVATDREAVRNIAGRITGVDSLCRIMKCGREGNPSS
jgi:hypothetical protein